MYFIFFVKHTLNPASLEDEEINKGYDDGVVLAQAAGSSPGRGAVQRQEVMTLWALDHRCGYGATDGSVLPVLSARTGNLKHCARNFMCFYAILSVLTAL